MAKWEQLLKPGTTKKVKFQSKFVDDDEDFDKQRDRAKKSWRKEARDRRSKADEEYSEF